MTRNKADKQAAAEQTVARFQAALGPFVVAAETTRMPMIFCNAKEPGRPIIFANDSFIALSGYARDEILGQPFNFLMDCPTDARACADVEAGFSGADGATAQIECRRKDGSLFLAAIYTSPVRDHQGEIVQYFASFVDLSGHVHQSQRATSALHTLYENTPGYIAITEGPAHTFTFANAAYLALVGHTSILGRTVATVMPELAEQGFIALLDGVYTSGEPFVGKNVAVNFEHSPGGGPVLRFLDFVYQPVCDSQGVVTGIFCEGQDVTDHAAAKERVAALQGELIHACRVNAMSTMAATMAHELNQSLTAISNYAAACRSILAAGGSTDTLDRALVAVGEGSRRAGDIIRRLRDMTLGRVTRREQFDLAEAIEESLALVRAGACQGGAIEFDRSTNILVEADRVQIQQVIVNLTRNACEATDPANVRVRVSIAVEGDEVRLAVDDSGPGVAPEAAERLFEWADSTKPEGTGIGLSISRTIIEAHHGKIWHDAEHEPATRFCFTLPIAAPSPA